MKMRLLRASGIKELYVGVEGDLDRYRAGNFDYLAEETGRTIVTDHEIDEHLLSKVVAKAIDHKEEIDNCKMLLAGMKDLSPYLARDDRAWVYLTHTGMLDYTRKRWPIPSDRGKAAEHVRTHFFVTGSRGFERDNAVSRLWWMASLSRRVSSLSLDQALEGFLYMSDVRASIIERPTTSQNTAVFSALIEKLYESYSGDKALFEREKFRGLMKALNLRGGTQLLDVLDKNSVREILDKYA